VIQLYTYLQSRLVGRDRERGATAVEYGIMVALIAAVIIATVATLGGKVNAAFNTVVSKL
jgi:pilus assembly protein Flp/PilA